MAQTQNEATTELVGLVKTTWEANAAGAPLYYDNEDSERPDTLAVFGRVAVRHEAGTRNTLGPNGIFRRFGTLYVQLFIKQGSGVTELRTLSDAIAHALEDVPASFGVFVRDVNVQELGSDGVYWQINVAAEFSYDRQS